MNGPTPLTGSAPAHARVLGSRPPPSARRFGLNRIAQATFWFFLVKGLLWLIVPGLVALGAWLAS